MNVYKDIDYPPDPIQLRDTTDDELFLIIDDKGCAPSPSNDSGVHHMEYRQHVLAKKCYVQEEAAAASAASQILPRKLQETPKKNDSHKGFRRRCRRKTDFAQLRSHSLSRTTKSARDDNADELSGVVVPKYQQRQRHDAIHFEIAKRMDEMSQLLQYENDVTVELAQKCAQYRAQNDRYNGGFSVDLCVEKVQAKLEQYSNAIVQNELELFKIKLEITQKCGVLHNLQRMLKMELVGDDDGEDRSRQIKSEFGSVEKETDVNFVDNIYEFCDNNKSIIV